MPRRVSKSKPFLQDPSKDTYFSTRLKDSHNKWVIRSLGVEKLDVANKLCKMIDQLRESGDIAALVRVADRNAGWNMQRVWQEYQAASVAPAKGPKRISHEKRVERLNEQLASADLDPLVTEWNGGLRKHAWRSLIHVRRLIPEGSKLKLHQLTRQLILAHLKALREEWGNGPNSRRQALSAISVFIEWMIDEKQDDLGLDGNVCRTIKVKLSPDEEDARMEAKYTFVHYTEDETKRIVAVLPAGGHTQAMVALMFGAGIEASVAARLRRDHFFGPQAIWASNVFFAEGRKNRARLRKIPVLVPWCVPIVRAYVARMEAENGGGDWWFVPRRPVHLARRKNKKVVVPQWDEKAIEKEFFAACDKVGVARIEGRRFHKFRHSLTEWGKDNNVPAHIIADNLGHVPGSPITSQIYGRADRLDKAEERGIAALKQAEAIPPVQLMA